MTGTSAIAQRLMNLTPHPITVLDQDDHVLITVAPEPTSARCQEHLQPEGFLLVDDQLRVPLARTSYGEVTGLPHEDARTVLIVSAVVAEALPQRTDLVVPVGQVVVDRQVLGCRALQRGRG